MTIPTYESELPNDPVRHIEITDQSPALDMFECYQHGKHLDFNQGKSGHMIVKYENIITVFTWNND